MAIAKFPLEEREWKGYHAPRRRKKKYAIEYRIKPGKPLYSFWAGRNDWSVHSRYASAQARTQALRSLSERDSLFEYRKEMTGVPVD